MMVYRNCSRKCSFSALPSLEFTARYTRSHDQPTPLSSDLSAAGLTEHESWIPATECRSGTFRVRGWRNLLLYLELTREGPRGAKDSVCGDVGSLPVDVEVQSG